jgi:D-psicose/D-tagatose/L-ribulose 3-epimerase
VRHCIDAAHMLGARNVIGPIYSAVGRLWQPTPDERCRDIDLLVRQLRGLAHYAGEHGVVLCIEPLNRFETSLRSHAALGENASQRDKKKIGPRTHTDEHGY